MIKVSDYIVKRLAEYGVRHIFMISGGGAMHLNDSVGRSKEIKYICNHHEQASAIGAEGYSRVSGKLAVVFTTSGPGGINALTGVMGQWTDSVPVLYISGQVKQETTIHSCPEIELRQLGDQEVNIVEMVKPVTKFAATIKKPQEVEKLLDKAIYIATHGRPGPVWLDVPLDIQGAMVDEAELIRYKKDNIIIEDFTRKLDQVIEVLKKAQRPVIIAGNGIHISGAEKQFYEFIRKLGIPVVSTFNAMDLIPSDHPLYVGRIGTVGDRAGNFALQNSDSIISLASRNNIRQISYNWKTYARAATKIIIDIDPAELNKPTIKPDIAIQADIKDFLIRLESKIEKMPDWSNWLNWCIERKNRYNTVLSEYKDINNLVHPYYFIRVLTETMQEGAKLVAGNGSACVCTFQAGIIKKNQRFIWNSGCASMGYDLPAAIGASIASDNGEVICLAGDGSLQMNIQELQTLVHYNLPVKLFVLNNSGYISIKQTQDSFFNSNYVACDQNCGVSFPDIVKIAQAYGLPTEIIDNHLNLQEKIQKVLQTPGPVVCEVKLISDYKFSPKLSSEKKPAGKIISKPLEDMYPFLNREEFKSNMIIPCIEE